MSARPLAFVFAPARRGADVCLRLVAFGERDARKGTRRVYERAHARRHGSIRISGSGSRSARPTTVPVQPATSRRRARAGSRARPSIPRRSWRAWTVSSRLSGALGLSCLQPGRRSAPRHRRARRARRPSSRQVPSGERSDWPVGVFAGPVRSSSLAPLAWAPRLGYAGVPEPCPQRAYGPLLGFAVVGR